MPAAIVSAIEATSAAAIAGEAAAAINAVRPRKKFSILIYRNNGF
jgi:hypothetical protein